MQLSAILLARVLLFVETFDLNPRGTAFFPAIVEGLVEKCGFMKFPQKIEDFDENKGVEFLNGRWGNVTIEALKVFNNGIQLDTRVSTGESERIIQEAINWAVSTYGITFSPKMVSRTGYVSDLTFHTDVPILGSAYPPIQHLIARCSELSKSIRNDSTPWQPTVLTIHSDAWPRKPLHAAFTIQRRAETGFSENKYYSEAPFPTDTHIQLLELFEKDVQAAIGHGQVGSTR